MDTLNTFFNRTEVKLTLRATEYFPYPIATITGSTDGSSHPEFPVLKNDCASRTNKQL
ncbi:hypothetical protein MGWOODY_XGa1806 [hydrothermal vent metagenome]|uniref:Uncharacterized protein n=1 Tax=hydrothermal vent metagenome TaxID=652676 RepID=A0A170PSA8_9ZZZZ